MRIFDRLFLFLFSIAFFIVSLFALLIGTGIFEYDFLNDMLDQLYADNNLRLTIIIVSAIIIILSIYLLIKSLQNRNIASFIHNQSDIGEIRISMETLENLASKASSKVKGVREQKVRVRAEENETVTVLVKIFVDGDIPIPQITEEIQYSVKEKLEQIAGVAVGPVHVIVSNIAQSHIRKARVE